MRRIDGTDFAGNKVGDFDSNKVEDSIGNKVEDSDGNKVRDYVATAGNLEGTRVCDTVRESDGNKVGDFELGKTVWDEVGNVRGSVC